MNRRTLWIIVIALFIVLVPLVLYLPSHINSLRSSNSSDNSVEANQADMGLTKIYVGSLPCADCTGIDSTLSLTKKDLNTAEGTYAKSEQYIGKDSKGAVNSKGDWTTQRGNNADPDATIIVLNPTDKEKIEYYLQLDENHLEMLDKDGEQSKASGNFTLTLQK